MSPSLNVKLHTLILAGGQARRCAGQDKGLLRPRLDNPEQLCSVALLLATLKKQTQVLSAPWLLSANRHQARYTGMGFTVLGDLREGFQGPLAGLEASLGWMNNQAPGDMLLSVGCDSPFFDARLVKAMYTLASNTGCSAYLQSAREIKPGELDVQPCFAIYQPQHLAQLPVFLDGDKRSVRAFLAHIQAQAWTMPTGWQWPVNFNEASDYLPEADISALS